MVIQFQPLHLLLCPGTIAPCAVQVTGKLAAARLGVCKMVVQLPVVACTYRQTRSIMLKKAAQNNKQQRRRTEAATSSTHPPAVLCLGGLCATYHQRCRVPHVRVLTSPAPLTVLISAVFSLFASLLVLTLVPLLAATLAATTPRPCNCSIQVCVP